MSSPEVGKGADPSTRRQPDRPDLRRASHWLCAASGRDPSLVAALNRVYGSGSDVVHARTGRIAAMARTYHARFGDAPVVLARAPGRVNLMGRHIDHQGGHCNMLAIEADLYVMAGLRDDATVRMMDIEDERFPEAECGLGELLAGCATGPWRVYVDSAPVLAEAARFAGQWQQYVKAPIARFMAAHPDRKWPGLNLIVSGNVPVAAGLSSSSALVVAVAEAVCALTGLEMEPEAFAEICGEAEWYVGARGGAGDQAAMKFARQGCVVQLGFHPMRLERVAPWPDGWSLLVCNSGIQAKKSDGARNAFNQRVACYHIARELVRQSRPELADRVAHLRDLTPHRLGASDAEVAEIIAAIPEHLSRTEVRAALGAERADPLLASHQWPTGVYALRSVAMFGIAECERSRLCADRLEAGAVEDVGRMMNVSHAGDRVVGYGPMGKSHSDDVMADLIARCRSGAKLADEPGAYACSTPDIDAMVDTARRIPGVVGAQLSGAGLGGCMMVLARGSAVADAISALQESYYGPRGRPADVSVCRPVAGSGVLSL